MTAARAAASDAVMPVVEYEPGISDGSAPIVGAETAVPRLRVVTPDAEVRAHPPSSRTRDAAAFADAALRVVLEVIDRRRQPGHLSPLMAGGLADSVLVFARAMRTPRAAAVLRRARVQTCPDDQHAFEVAASYARDTRLHAIACRVELVQTAEGARWQLVALHIG